LLESVAEEIIEKNIMTYERGRNG